MHKSSDINSVKLGNTPNQLSNSVLNQRFVFEFQLNFNEHIINAKRKVIVNLISVSRIVKFIDKNSKT